MRKAYYLLLLLSYFILLVIFLPNSVYSQSGWFNQYSQPNYLIRCIAFADQNTGWACTAGGNGFASEGYFLRTVNGGTNWSVILHTNLGYTSFIFMNSETGWLVGNFFNDILQRACYIFKTQNSGINWTTQYMRTDSLSPSFYSICFVDLYTGFAGGYHGAFIKTTNSGSNWVLQPPISNYDIYSVKFINANTGFLACSAGRIFRSTNGGLNWSVLVTDTTSELRSICFIDASTGWIAGAHGSILKTTNCGINWISQSVYSSYSYNSVYFSSQNMGWVVGSNSIIQHTSNSGLTWTVQQVNTTCDLYTVYFINNLTGWTGGGFYMPLNTTVILKTTNGGNPLGIRQIGSEIPKQFSLSQNYPNPFNPVTKIKFSLPVPSEGGAQFVRLIIYDILGKEVPSLIPSLRGGQEGLQPGTYEVDWDGSNYPSGIYFYKLTTESFKQTKRMVLIK